VRLSGLVFEAKQLISRKLPLSHHDELGAIWFGPIGKERQRGNPLATSGLFDSGQLGLPQRHGLGNNVIFVLISTLYRWLPIQRITCGRDGAGWRWPARAGMTTGFLTIGHDHTSEPPF
jgi:hypothetical protein